MPERSHPTDRPASTRTSLADAQGRVSLNDALAWVDAHIARLETDISPVGAASGRVLAEPVAAHADIPPLNRSAIDGIAMRAEETFGASSYNPLSFSLAPDSATLPLGSAMRVHAGDKLPQGADSVLPLDYASFPDSDQCEIIEPAGSGAHVEAAASHAAIGKSLLPAGRRLRAGDIALLAEAGLAHVPVVRRPRVHVLIVSTEKNDHGNEMMLRALIERDGGILADLHRTNPDALHHAFTHSGRDVVIVAGGDSASALAEAGALDISSVALDPGEFTGMGHIGADIPVFLLPASPIACLFGYELIVGRAIRILAGRDPALPWPKRMMSTSRKIVSRIGMTEACPVRLIGDEQIEPIASFAAGGLVSAARADGFVLVPEGSEGFSARSLVPVHLFAGDGAA